MHLATMLAFQDEIEKIAGIGAGALDVAGLGLLAAPTIRHMRGKKMSDKNKNRAEIAGLGTLGASVAAEHAHDAVSAGKAGISKLRGLVSKLPKHASLDAWNPTSGALLSESGGSRALNHGTHTGRSPKPKFDLGALKAAYEKSGVKPRLSSVLNKVEKVAAPTMGAMMNMHRLADAAKAAKPMAGAVAGAGKALTNPGNMARASHLAGHMAQGGHAWNPAAAAKRAISL